MQNSVYLLFILIFKDNKKVNPFFLIKFNNTTRYLSKDWIIAEMNKICPGVVIFIGERFYYFANMGNGGVTETIENKIVEENVSENLSKSTDDVTELPEEIIEEIDEVKMNETEEISEYGEIMEEISKDETAEVKKEFGNDEEIVEGIEEIMPEDRNEIEGVKKETDDNAEEIKEEIVETEDKSEEV